MKKTSKRTSGSPKRSLALPLPVQRVLAAAHAVIESVGGSWYLFGAQAVALHGAPRTTKDIDVTVLLPSGDASQLLRAIRAGGFMTRAEDAAFLETARVIPARHRQTGWMVDFVLGGPGLEQHFRDQALVLRMGALRVPLIRLEHLIVLKCLAARPRDLEDLRRLFRRRWPDIDLAEVRELIVMLQTELGDSTIWPTLERIIAEKPSRCGR